MLFPKEIVAFRGRISRTLPWCMVARRWLDRAMDISQLKTLIHVAELGSLSKAADRLNIAQPALSRQIRLLEEELGIFLFERHGRGMVITDAGRKALARAT